MRFFTVSLFAALAAFASAYTPPNYNNPPSGNPIFTPGLNQQVPVGKPFEITWEPTTPGDVTIVLLRGPSNNVKPLYAIATSIPNSGKFEWTPSTDLQNDVTHYGLLLIVDATGQYQYSTQFGISNPNGPSSGSSSSESATSTAMSSATSTVTGTTTGTITTVSSTSTGQASGSVSASSYSSAHVHKSTSTKTPTSTVTLVGTGKTSVPFVSPTKTPYKPTTLITTITSTAPVESPPASSSSVPLPVSNAAGHNAAHMGGVSVAAALIALFAF